VDTSVASQHKASPSSSPRINNEVEAATVVIVDVWRGSARKPLPRDYPTIRANSLASDLNPRPFDDEPAPQQQACAGAGEVVVPICIDRRPTSMVAYIFGN